MVGYHEVDGKIESSENYLNRVQSYMKLYAAIVQVCIHCLNLMVLLLYVILLQKCSGTCS